MPDTPDITVYGAFWCPDCHRAKQFLGEHQIPYDWVDVEENPEGERFVLEANDGKRSIPTIAFADDTILTNPSNAELAKKLDLKTHLDRRHFDLVIVGAGPAGLTAALYAAREGIETVVIERAALGGQAAATMQLDNVPGFHEGVSGDELAKRFRLQAERFGVQLLQAQSVVETWSHDQYHCVKTEDGSRYSGDALLLATGSSYRRLGVPGEADYIGAGVHFCATCDGPFYKGREVAVVGGGNSAAEESLFLSRYAEHVTLLVRGDRLKASAVIQEKVLEDPTIDVRFHHEVEAFEGKESKLRTIRIRNNATGETDTLELPGAFIFIGLDPNTGFLTDSPVTLDQWGFVLTGHRLAQRGVPLESFDREPALLETSVPGVFAAGDVRRDSTKQVASAAGEGAAAALMVKDYLKGW